MGFCEFLEGGRTLDSFIAAGGYTPEWLAAKAPKLLSDLSDPYMAYGLTQSVLSHAATARVYASHSRSASSIDMPHQWSHHSEALVGLLLIKSRMRVLLLYGHVPTESV